MNLRPRIDNICDRLHARYEIALTTELGMFETLLAKIETDIDRYEGYTTKVEQ